MALRVITDLLPEGHPNRPGIKLYDYKARIWHGTANTNQGADAEGHRYWVGRPFKRVWDEKRRTKVTLEADGRPFIYGSAHAYIDHDSAVILIPMDEVAYGSGDRSKPWTPEYKGQQPLAKELFDNKQNFYSLQIELCMNRMDKWDQVLENALEFIVDYMPGADKHDLRHYDLTGKICPSPLVNMAIKEEDPRWSLFKYKIKDALNGRVLPEGTPLIRVDGEIINYKMDVQPFIKDSRTMVPLRFIAEHLNKKVKWLQKERIVDIT